MNNNQEIMKAITIINKIVFFDKFFRPEINLNEFTFLYKKDKKLYIAIFKILKECFYPSNNC
jgi:hypothetical protein